MNPTDPGPIYIVHQTPVGRRESNFIAQVDLAPFDLAGQFEQIWLHDQGEGTYALACIPFMAYGLALGDMVRLSSQGMVADLVQAGGRRVLRLLMTEDPDTDRLARTVQESKIASRGPTCSASGTVHGSSPSTSHWAHAPMRSMP